MGWLGQLASLRAWSQRFPLLVVVAARRHPGGGGTGVRTTRVPSVATGCEDLWQAASESAHSVMAVRSFTRQRTTRAFTGTGLNSPPV